MTTEALAEKTNQVKKELHELGDIAAKLVRENPWTAAPNPLL